jgi:methylated-DNA-protein-cysteine methyltransferase-like protein
MRRPAKRLRPVSAATLLQVWETADRRKLRAQETVPLRGDAAVDAICAVIRRIPRGWVATYGQVAAMAGLPRRARLVGRILLHLDPASRIPWHRVVNAKGEVSHGLSRNGGDILQRHLLEKEGLTFDDNNRLDLERCRWRD